MPITVRLLGPDLPQDYSITAEASMTITQVKEIAMREWPASAGRPARLATHRPPPSLDFGFERPAAAVPTRYPGARAA